MRATRWSLLVAASALAAACSSGSVEVTMPEPPPVTAAVAEPEAAPEVLDATTLPPAPVPEVPAPALDDAAAAAEDDPVPIGAAPRRAAPAAGGTAPAGAVRAAHAAKSSKPQPTGRIEIPTIGLNHQTYEGIDLATIDHGPSHWPGTPMPGQRGNTVFPGHRTTHSRPFWDLDKLVPGNQVIFTTPAGRFTYVVQRTLIVGANDTWVVNDTPDATFTVIACHPKGSAKQRIVVKGTLVGSPTGASAPAPGQPATTTTTRPKILGIL